MNTPVEIYEISAAKLAKSCRSDLTVAPTFRALSPEQDSRDSNRLKKNNAIIPGRAADSAAWFFHRGPGKICRISGSNTTGFLS